MTSNSGHPSGADQQPSEVSNARKPASSTNQNNDSFQTDRIDSILRLSSWRNFDSSAHVTERLPSLDWRSSIQNEPGTVKCIQSPKLSFDSSRSRSDWSTVKSAQREDKSLSKKRILGKKTTIRTPLKSLEVERIMETTGGSAIAPTPSQMGVVQTMSTTIDLSGEESLPKDTKGSLVCKPSNISVWKKLPTITPVKIGGVDFDAQASASSSTNLDYQNNDSKKLLLHASPLATTQNSPEEPSKSYEQMIAESQGPLHRNNRDHVAERPVAKVWSLLPGSIIWMPLRTPSNGNLYCVRESHCGGKELNSTGYNHPGIILGTHSDVFSGNRSIYVTVAQVSESA